jgi:hypothetical protein
LDRPKFPTVAKYYAHGDCVKGISVAMYTSFHRVVLAAINLGHPQIEQHGLILAAHVRLGALETDPIANVGVGGPVESFESVFTVTSERGRGPVHIAPNLLGTCGHIASWTEKVAGSCCATTQDASQRFGIATYVLPARSLALPKESLEVL